MKKKNIIIIAVAVVILLIGVFSYITLFTGHKEDTSVSFSVNAGDNKIKIVSNLKKAGLIKSKFTTLAYVFINPSLNLQAGKYTFNKKQNAISIINQINDGKIDQIVKTINITFVEGKSIETYLKQIEANFDITYDDMIKTLKDEKFLDSLIKDYSFITNSIKNKDIYYSLEGYLYPDTYEFYENSSFETIVRTMLNNTKKKLSTLDFKKSKYSIHELLTIASIIEQEAVNKEDREKVSQVIYTRLDKKMALGMDVTAYYGSHLSLKETITTKELNAVNPYNTRNLSFIGLPVGPICNPSLESINAALNPSNTNFEYFYADINTGKVYFAEDIKGFYEIQEKLGEN